MNNLPAVDGMYPVVVGGSGLASLAVPESPRTGVYYASLGGTVVIRNVNPATVVSQLETAAASWLTSMGLAMDDPATAEMAINMVQPEAIAVSTEPQPQPFLKSYNNYVCDLDNNRILVEYDGLTQAIMRVQNAWTLEERNPSQGYVTKALTFSDETHASLTEDGFTYEFRFTSAPPFIVVITPDVE